MSARGAKVKNRTTSEFERFENTLEKIKIETLNIMESSEPVTMCYEYESETQEENIEKDSHL